jgi:hypothetical protein
MHRVAAKFVPRILTANQKQQLVDVLIQQFLAKQKGLSSPTHTTPLIWQLMTSSY